MTVHFFPKDLPLADKLSLFPVTQTAVGMGTAVSNIVKVVNDIGKLILNPHLNEWSTPEVQKDLKQHARYVVVGLLRALPIIGTIYTIVVIKKAFAAEAQAAAKKAEEEAAAARDAAAAEAAVVPLPPPEAAPAPSTVVAPPPAATPVNAPIRPPTPVPQPPPAVDLEARRNIILSGLQDEIVNNEESYFQRLDNLEQRILELGNYVLPKDLKKGLRIITKGLKEVMGCSENLRRQFAEIKANGQLSLLEKTDLYALTIADAGLFTSYQKYLASYEKIAKSKNKSKSKTKAAKLTDDWIKTHNFKFPFEQGELLYTLVLELVNEPRQKIARYPMLVENMFKEIPKGTPTSESIARNLTRIKADVSRAVELLPKNTAPKTDGQT